MKTQVSESFFLGGLLAMVGGFLDAYTYLVRGGVFANAQTGNIVLLAIRLAEGAWGKAAIYLIPVLTYALGVLLADGLRRLRLGLHWRQLAVGLEVLVLLGTALVPAGAGNAAVNILISFVCAVQTESFRKVEGDAMATTMCTGNLRSASAFLATFLAQRDTTALSRSLRYFAVIGFFILGATLGTLAVGPWGTKAVLLPCGALCVAFCAMFIEKKPEGEA